MSRATQAAAPVSQLQCSWRRGGEPVTRDGSTLLGHMPFHPSETWLQRGMEAAVTS